MLVRSPLRTTYLAVLIVGFGQAPSYADSQSPLGATEGTKKPCSCRYRGQDVLFGKTICMKTANGYVRARCSRYLNNTAWEISSTPCLEVSRRHQSQGADTSG